jgi:hypothetical protein
MTPLDFIITILKMDGKVLYCRLGECIYEALSVYEEKKQWTHTPYLYSRAQVLNQDRPSTPFIPHYPGYGETTNGLCH